MMSKVLLNWIYLHVNNEGMVYMYPKDVIKELHINLDRYHKYRGYLLDNGYIEYIKPYNYKLLKGKDNEYN